MVKESQKEVHNIHNNENRQFTSRHRRECLCTFYVFRWHFRCEMWLFHTHFTHKHKFPHTHTLCGCGFRFSFFLLFLFYLLLFWIRSRYVVLAVHSYGGVQCAHVLRVSVYFEVSDLRCVRHFIIIIILLIFVWIFLDFICKNNEKNKSNEVKKLTWNAVNRRLMWNRKKKYSRIVHTDRRFFFIWSVLVGNNVES